MRLEQVELKEKCRERKLKISGGKSQLIDWLLGLEAPRGVAGN